MILIRPSFEIMEVMGIEPLKLIEKAGRTCYKSEDKVTKDSSIKFVQRLNDLGHESVIEHSAMTVKIVCDRGVSHELVRHRLAAFSQESTRYCNYKGGVTFVIPPWIDAKVGEYRSPEDILYTSKDFNWFVAMYLSENMYIKLLQTGWSPQQARSVLPNSLKTEIVITANFREWKHIFRLRCQLAAHPQMREIMIPLLHKCKEKIPVIFDNINY